MLSRTNTLIFIAITITFLVAQIYALKPNFQPKSTPISFTKQQFFETINTISKKTLPLLISGALLLNLPDDALAASSGGRAGGSSFRSSPSRSSYSSPSSSSGRSSTRLYSYSSPTFAPIITTPFYNPYPFVPFIPINTNVILLAGVAYLAYNVISNRVGGSDFSNENMAGSLGSDASVIKLQVALDSNWMEQGNIMETLTYLSSKRGSSYSSRNELSSLLSESALALLRKKSDWNAAAIDSEYFNGVFNNGKAEPLFQKLSIQERSKFERETNGYSGEGIIRSDGSSTQTVVSIIVAIRGKSEAIKKNIQSVRDVQECLQSLASECLTDDGENIMAVEVLWTPSERGTTISKRQLIDDYPELIEL